MEHRGIITEDIHDSQLSTNNRVLFIYLFIEDIKSPFQTSATHST